MTLSRLRQSQYVSFQFSASSSPSFVNPAMKLLLKGRWQSQSMGVAAWRKTGAVSHLPSCTEITLQLTAFPQRLSFRHHAQVSSELCPETHAVPFHQNPGTRRCCRPIRGFQGVQEYAVYLPVLDTFRDPLVGFTILYHPQHRPPTMTSMTSRRKHRKSDKKSGNASRKRYDIISF